MQPTQRTTWRGQVLRGVLDTLLAAVIVTLVAANTGFLPVDETQNSAQAGFGVCNSEACPSGCTVWSMMAIGMPPYYVMREDTCQVSAPGTQWTGYCDGICGICPLGNRCSGTTVFTLMPCMCIEQGC